MLKSERKRLQSLLHYEEDLWMRGYRHIAGVDEAGRGSLVGPVFAAACIVPRGVLIEGVDDSKKLTPQKREKVFSLILANKDVVYAVGSVDEKKIDEVNILKATHLAMQQALSNLAIVPDFVLFDGRDAPECGIEKKTVVRGDSLVFSIALASIIAKCMRDALMRQYHEKFPVYGWKNNMGYGTKEHIKALKTYGPCELHRETFNWRKNISSSEE